LYASLPVTARLGVLTMPQVLGVALLAGSANVIFTTAYQVFLPALVRPADLMEGNAKLQASLSACAIAGPGLAGLAAGTAGASAALLANSVSFLVSAGCLLSIPPAGLRQPRRRPRRPIRATVAEGVRYVAGDSGLRLLTIWAAAQNLFLAGFTALAVVYLVRSAGFKPATAGLLLAAGGIGGVLGALAARRLAERYGSAGALRVTAFTGMPFTLLIPLAARGWHILFFLAGFPVASGALAAGAVILGSFRQAACPPELLGRVVAAMRFLAYGANPVGALLAGSLATWLGLRAALWITLTGWVATGAFLLAPVVRNRELPAPSANTKTHRAQARPESATCLDRLRELGDLGSSDVEQDGLARESAAVAFAGVLAHERLRGQSCSPGEDVAQERSALPEVALPFSPGGLPLPNVRSVPMSEVGIRSGALPPRCQVAVARLDQAIKPVAEEAAREQSQPSAAGGACHRAEDRVQSLHLLSAGQHRRLDDEETDQHQHDGARDAAIRTNRPRDHGQRPGHVLCGEPLPEVEPDRPATHFHGSRHDKEPNQDQEQLAPSRSKHGCGHVDVLSLLRLRSLPRRSLQQKLGGAQAEG